MWPGCTGADWDLPSSDDVASITRRHSSLWTVGKNLTATGAFGPATFSSPAPLPAWASTVTRRRSCRRGDLVEVETDDIGRLSNAVCES